jgi:hypothetical protein
VPDMRESLEKQRQGSDSDPRATVSDNGELSHTDPLVCKGGTLWDESRNPVEAALAFALGEAARAGRVDVVAQLARELEARRLASIGSPRLEDKQTRR